MVPPPQTVSVKWNKQVFTNIPLPTTSDEFKAELRALTGVQENRMSLVCVKVWKGSLPSGISFSSFSNWPCNNTVTILLLGTKTEDVTSEPTEKVVFLEDTLVASAATKILPAGLHNLGNTCYLNSVLQILRMSPEFEQAVVSQAQGGGGPLLGELRNLLQELKQTRNLEVVPLRFVSVMRQIMSQFNEKNTKGQHLQQDADEFYNELMTKLKPVAHSLFQLHFSVQQEQEFKVDFSWRMQCMINEKVDFLAQGLKLGLETVLEKRSGENTIQVQEVKRLSQLPKNLVVQLNRFFWKLTPESMDHRGVNCKILRTVKFPEFLDTYEFCTPTVQRVLNVNRELKTALPAAATAAVSMTEEEEELEKALKLSMMTEEEEDEKEQVFGAHVSSHFTGRYELFGVVSHKGRSATSGHYMAWVKQSSPTGKEQSKWICFDDDHPSECSWKEVEALCGGGDHHMAFMLLYRATSN